MADQQDGGSSPTDLAKSVKRIDRTGNAVSYFEAVNEVGRARYRDAWKRDEWNAAPGSPGADRWVNAEIDLLSGVRAGTWRTFAQQDGGTARFELQTEDWRSDNGIDLAALVECSMSGFDLENRAGLIFAHGSKRRYSARTPRFRSHDDPAFWSRWSPGVWTIMVELPTSHLEPQAGGQSTASPGASSQPQPHKAPRKGGRRKGVGGLAAKDAPLIDEMHRLCSSGEVETPIAAARKLAPRAGGASEDATIKRLCKRYYEKFPGE